MKLYVLAIVFLAFACGSVEGVSQPDADPQQTADATPYADSPVLDASPTQPDARPTPDADPNSPDADPDYICDVFDPESCGHLGLTCYFREPGDGADGICEFPGSVPHGGACTKNNDCAPSEACFGGKCAWICHWAAFGGTTGDPRCGGLKCGMLAFEYVVGGCI